MTFREWWAGLGRSYDPETIWKAAQRAAVAQAREVLNDIRGEADSEKPDRDPQVQWWDGVDPYHPLV